MPKNSSQKQNHRRKGPPPGVPALNLQSAKGEVHVKDAQGNAAEVSCWTICKNTIRKTIYKNIVSFVFHPHFHLFWWFFFTHGLCKFNGMRFWYTFWNCHLDLSSIISATTSILFSDGVLKPRDLWLSFPASERRIEWLGVNLSVDQFCLAVCTEKHNIKKY